MYLPQAFEENRIEVLHMMMRAHPLMTLITQNDSTLIADHIPVQTVLVPPPYGLLRGHVARANSLWKQIGDQESLAIFQGPQVYISPSLYPSKRATGKVVPTWDYAVVHAYGTLRFIHDADWLLTLVEGLTNAHEADRISPWQVNDAPAGYIRNMLAAIVGFEFLITRITGKWKISQNRSISDQSGVIEGLRAAGDENSREVADLLSAHGDERRTAP